MSGETAFGGLSPAFDWLQLELKSEIARRAGKSRRSKKAPAPPDTLAALIETFRLSPFEGWLLTLLAGAELDHRISETLAELTDGKPPRAVSFELALSVLPDGHWSAMSATRPLRRWKFVEREAGGPMRSAVLTIDERALAHLMGVDAIDARLSPFLSVHESVDTSTPSQANVIHDMAACAAIAEHQDAAPVLQLCAGDPRTMGEIAATFYRNHGLRPLRLPVQKLPTEPEKLADFAMLWERETGLGNVALLLDAHGAENDHTALAAATLFLDQISAPVIILAAERLSWLGAIHSFDMTRPTVAEQAKLWSMAPGLDKAAASRLAQSLSMEARDIRAIVETVAQGDEASPDLEAKLWDASRRMAAPGEITGVSVSRPKTPLEALRLPPAQLDAIRQIIARLGNRAAVYGDWGYGDGQGRGLGTSALFSGPSGTGKTFAAEVLAAAAARDLYRVDVSSVVDKYIGETEKNLRRIFDKAEQGGAVLLFDEADALFGKRGEVKDSHDRFANIGVSYLLQRFEAHRGLTILTTNLKEAIDRAFLRRFSFTIDFPFPDAETRRALWQNALTAETPVEDLDFDALARLHASGAEIRNIVLGAAFLAAEDGGPVTMSRIRRAAALEMEKAGRKLTQADARGWA